MSLILTYATENVVVMEKPFQQILLEIKFVMVGYERCPFFRLKLYLVSLNLTLSTIYLKFLKFSTILIH